MNADDLTTDEVAKLLKVSKLTVYDLIKKGEIASYRVGRQIRVERDALQVYKGQPHTTNPSNKQVPASAIISGQDNSLDILAKHLNHSLPSKQFLRSYMGSLDGLIAMYQGEADIVSTHLFDGDTGKYNIPYLRKILVNKSFIVIHLMKRKAGLYVAKDNPINITNWDSLKKPNITLANRETGAGARVLLDEQLRLHSIDKHMINGYNNVYTSHIDVASAIVSGKSDVGVGIEQVAKLANIDFIEQIEENYDLVILNTPENKEIIEHIMTILHDNTFIQMLQSLHYGTNHTGEVIYKQ